MMNQSEAVKTFTLIRRRNHKRILRVALPLILLFIISVYLDAKILPEEVGKTADSLLTIGIMTLYLAASLFSYLYLLRAIDRDCATYQFQCPACGRNLFTFVNLAGFGGFRAICPKCKAPVFG